MKLNVRLFATLKERASSNSLSLDLPDSASVETLLATLASQAVRASRRCAFAQNCAGGRQQRLRLPGPDAFPKR